MTNNYKFRSGLTWNEAETLVDQYVDGFKSQDIAIACLKSHLKTAVRDHEFFRNLVGSLIEDQRAGKF